MPFEARDLVIDLTAKGLSSPSPLDCGPELYRLAGESKKPVQGPQKPQCELTTGITGGGTPGVYDAHQELALLRHELHAALAAGAAAASSGAPHAAP